MEGSTTTTDTAAQGRRTRTSTTAPNSPPTYGYHQTYHTHGQLPVGAPPPYARASDPKVLKLLEEKARTEAAVARRTPLPPSYSCSVEIRGVLGVKQELSSPFSVAGNREWYDAFIILQGTQLSLYRVKQPGLLSKNRRPIPGRLLRSYTLQHAEVGVASDFKKTSLVPKSPFAHLVPATARPKLYETDPHLFEPVREHAIRLRLETEQFLICAPTHGIMLNWIEFLCAAIDISPPIEDRSEPRYRSLPRRSRRQRILEGAATPESTAIENLSSLEAGRRIIAQQEQIIRQLYPHLANNREPGSTTSPAAATQDTTNELDEFDPEDVRFPSSTRRLSSSDDSTEQEQPSDQDRKTADRLIPTESQILRYRRRCAPVLLASSPRVSDVVFSDGKRMRISVKEHMLVDYTPHPPRYDAHQFPKSKMRLAKAASKVIPTPVTVVPTRPGSPLRGITDDSIASITFGEDLVAQASRSHEDVSSSSESGPPSPTGISQIKTDASTRLAEMGKRRASVERNVSEVVLGVGLII